MKHLICACLLSAALVSQSVIAKNKTLKLPDELILNGDNVIKAQIEGKPVTLQVRPETWAFVTLNSDAGKRLGLNFDKVAVEFVYRIGPNMVDAPTKVLRINLGAKNDKNRIAWATRHTASTVADGIISPIKLPYKRVIFNLRNNVSAKLKEYVLPLNGIGFLGMEGVGTNIKTGKAKAQVNFSLTKQDNLVDATTANWLARRRGAQFVDTAREIEIAYGIKRPVRKIELGEAIMVGPFALKSMMARTSDNGDTAGIKVQETAAPVAADTNEIVVTGKKERNDEDDTIRVTLGYDFLQTCTRITYDFEKRQIRMMCAVPG